MYSQLQVLIKQMGSIMIVSNREVQSVFGAANLGYKDMLFLDVTGRTDWSSTLSFTDSKSFFYPSVGLTGVITEMFEMPEAVSFAKIRVSYAEVGRDLPAFASNSKRRFNPVTGFLEVRRYGSKPGETLEPENQKSYEIGTEWRFLGNRLGLDLTYYSSYYRKSNILYSMQDRKICGFDSIYCKCG